MFLTVYFICGLVGETKTYILNRTAHYFRCDPVVMPILYGHGARFVPTRPGHPARSPITR